MFCYVLTITTAISFAKELKNGRNLKRIVKSLERSMVSEDVLQKSELEKQLSEHVLHDILGDRIKELLNRFFMISHGQFDAVNDAVEKSLGLKDEKKERSSKMNSKKSKEENKLSKSILKPSSQMNRKVNVYSMRSLQNALMEVKAESKNARCFKEKQMPIKVIRNASIAQ